MPTVVLDLDIQNLPHALQGLERYERAFMLFRYRRQPITTLTLPVKEGNISNEVLHDALFKSVGQSLWEHKLHEWLDAGISEPPTSHPAATIAICTRDRVEDLQRCLDSVMALPDDGQEILVVDNAPATEGTRLLVSRYPRVRYVLEERPGLDCARNRAIREASHPIVAFTDDDSVLDEGWLRAITGPFHDPSVQCVTGLTLPLELETPAQEWFERFSTFNRGFKRRSFDLGNHNPLSAGAVGAGVNMALRRDVLDRLGPFVEALDAGTPTHSGGDHEMFTRILRNGYRIVYEPTALNWHRHRRSWDALRKAIYGYGVGVYAMYTHHYLVHGDRGVFRQALGWFRHNQLRNLARTILRRPNAPPLDLLVAELRGCIAGPWAYLRSRKKYPVGAGRQI